jgi:putative DNA primase/helicase
LLLPRRTPALHGRARFLAVHRTAIAHDGSGRAKGPDGKPLKKFVLGSPKGGGVLLGQISDAIIIAEGIESAASVQMATGKPAVATLGTPGMKALELPDSVRDVIIFGDHDMPGLEAAKMAAERFARERRTVRIAIAPKEGDDANDLLQKSGAAAIQEAVDRAEPISAPSPECCPLPKGFRYAKDGSVQYSSDDKDGEQEWHWLCSPVEVLARTSDEEDKNHGLLLAITTADGKRHLWALPMELLAGAGEEYRKCLLSMGLRLAAGTRPRNALHNLLMQVRPPRRMTCVERAGWHGRTYVLPTGAFGDGAANTVFQVSTAIDHRYSQRATLEEWQTNVAALAAGNSALIFGISVAFAAALVRPLGEESGIFNFRGESSTGKTTALRVACSVYGSGADDGFRHSWRITDNALESLAYARCDSLVALDEMSQVQPKHVGAIAYMYANGSGKGRADRIGNARPIRRWTGLLLSTGEQGIADLITEVEREVLPGQLVRFVDIPASGIGSKGGLFDELHRKATPGEFAKHLAHMTERYHGTAGPAFLEYLANNYDTAIECCRKCIDDFIAQAISSTDGPQVQRVARRFGLVAAAGELACAAGIVPWKKGEAFKAALKLFRLWKEQRGTPENAEGQQALQRVRAFLEQNAARFVTDAGEPYPKECAGFVVGKDGKEVVDLPECVAGNLRRS